MKTPKAGQFSTNGKTTEPLDLHVALVNLFSRSPSPASHQNLLSDIRTLESFQSRIGGADWTDDEQAAFVHLCHGIRNQLCKLPLFYETSSCHETPGTEQAVILSTLRRYQAFMSSRAAPSSTATKGSDTPATPPS